MIIKTKKTVEVETEISLPAFYKTTAHRFKIYSDTNCICVTNNQEISVKHSQLPFNIGAVESNEVEFLTAYNQTLLILNQLV